MGEERMLQYYRERMEKGCNVASKVMMVIMMTKILDILNIISLVTSFLRHTTHNDQ